MAEEEVVVQRKGAKTAAERRRHPVGRDPRADARRERAEARQEAYDALTVEQKIERAESRPGRSVRELGKLRRLKA